MSTPRLRWALVLAAMIALPAASRLWAEEAQGPRSHATLSVSGMT